VPEDTDETKVFSQVKEWRTTTTRRRNNETKQAVVFYERERGRAKRRAVPKRKREGWA